MYRGAERARLRCDAATKRSRLRGLVVLRGKARREEVRDTSAGLRENRWMCCMMKTEYKIGWGLNTKWANSIESRNQKESGNQKNLYTN